MKATVEMSAQEVKTNAQVHDELKSKLADLKRGEILLDLQKHSGYAKYTFSGTFSPAAIEALGRMPTGSEIIMLVDGGFSHFGASCSIDSTGKFSGYVYTD